MRQPYRELCRNAKSYHTVKNHNGKSNEQLTEMIYIGEPYRYTANREATYVQKPYTGKLCSMGTEERAT